RRAYADYGRAYGELVAQVEGDAAALRLVRAGDRRLDHHRIAELERGGDCLVCALDDALRHERETERLEHGPRRVRIEPRFARSFQRASDDAPRLVDVHVVARG